MAQTYRDSFFDGVKDHSQLKLRAIDRYLRPWMAKVGSIPGSRRLWIVDGFAGPGRYGTGQLGSAGIALREAAAAVSAGRSYKVACYFIDREKAHVQSLSKLRSEHPGVECLIEQGDFWTKIQNIVEFVESDPVLLLVDPFGLKDLDFQRLVTLCNGLAKIDLMITLMSPAARRLEKNYASLVDQAVGGPGWNADSVTQVFCERLATNCNFLPPASLPVGSEIGGLRYELLLASRHPAAYELWNDEVAAADRAILDGPDPDAIARRIGEAKKLLLALARPMRLFTRRALISKCRLEHCGEIHGRVYLRAVDELLKTDWTKSDGPIATASLSWR